MAKLPTRVARGTENNLPVTILINVDKTRWMEQANCVGADPAVENSAEAQKFAKDHCAGCPVWEQCLAYGIATKANSIVYGGVYFNTFGTPNLRWTDHPITEWPVTSVVA